MIGQRYRPILDLVIGSKKPDRSFPRTDLRSYKEAAESCTDVDPRWECSVFSILHLPFSGCVMGLSSFSFLSLKKQRKPHGYMSAVVQKRARGEGKRCVTRCCQVPHTLLCCIASVKCPYRSDLIPILCWHVDIGCQVNRIILGLHIFHVDAPEQWGLPGIIEPPSSIQASAHQSAVWCFHAQEKKLQFKVPEKLGRKGTFEYSCCQKGDTVHFKLQVGLFSLQCSSLHFPL